MSNEELAGRVVALEVISMTALGLYLANAKNDPDGSRTKAIFQALRSAISAHAQTLPPETRSHAIKYGDALLDQVEQNLPALVGHTGIVN